MTLSYAPPTPKPAVVTWYFVYCAMMALLYLLCVIGGALFLIYEPDMKDSDPRLLGVMLIGLGAILMIGFAIGPFFPRNKVGWIYGLVLIGIGVSGCTLVAAVPLLIFWIRADCKAWYGFDTDQASMPSPPR